MKLNHKLFLFLFIAFMSNMINAQHKKTKLKGIVKNEKHVLQDINIFNKSTKLGTSSSKNGKFSIIASEGDSIEFSSIIYKNRTIKISERHILTKTITVYLETDFNELDEIMLDKKVYLSSINLAVTEGTIFDNDKVSSSKAPDARKFTDPNANGGGINFISIFKQLTKKGRLKRKKRKLELKKIKLLKDEFSITLRNSYGDDFFIEWLHVSENKINLFLDYCEGNGLSNLYNSNEILVKDFLIKQAKIFNTFDKE